MGYESNKLRWALALCALMSWPSATTRGVAQSGALGDPLTALLYPRADEPRALPPRALDELDVSRVAEDAGDARLLAALRDPSQRQVAALAARAAAHARAPEALIVPLAKLACGRDPALAPEAAHALWSLADQLSPSRLSAREVLRSDLVEAQNALRCRELAPRPRADISIALGQLAATLDVLLR